MSFIPAPPSAPPPAPPPPPPPAATPEGANTALDIIDNAPTGNFVVAGVSSANWMEASPSVSTADADQPQMRYDAATNTYQVQLPGAAWETLWTKDTTEPDWARPLGVGTSNAATMFLNSDREIGKPDGYVYSSMGAYVFGVSGWGEIAFGIPTAAAAMPTSGSAQYEGIISGVADIYVPGYEWAEMLGVAGTVSLSFDFSRGTLAGSMSPALSNGESLGTFTFKNTVYSGGAYSGEFDSSANGANHFSGHMTGPNGEELIGAWALPFHYQGDDKDHQAIGGWVAKH